MQVKAYAKINIALDVVGKREDGYHLLKMIMQQVDIYDVLTLDKEDSGIKLSTNKAFLPSNNKNLVYRAAELFMEAYNISEGVRVHIKKNIPVAAGMAGGSSDAAAALLAFNRLFGVNAPVEELIPLGLKLGADVPYCMVGGTALCEGIGEIITPLKPFKNHILVVVKPKFGISTREVYENLDINRIFRHPEVEELILAMKRDDVAYVASNMKNVLENVTLKKHHILIDIKEEMKRLGALGALMSGSGPTVFGFFEDMQRAQYCYDYMKSKFEEVFITRTI